MGIDGDPLIGPAHTALPGRIRTATAADRKIAYRTWARGSGPGPGGDRALSGRHGGSGGSGLALTWAKGVDGEDLTIFPMPIR